MVEMVWMMLFGCWCSMFDIEFWIGMVRKVDDDGMGVVHRFLVIHGWILDYPGN